MTTQLKTGDTVRISHLAGTQPGEYIAPRHRGALGVVVDGKPASTGSYGVIVDGIVQLVQPYYLTLEYTEAEAATQARVAAFVEAFTYGRPEGDDAVLRIGRMVDGKPAEFTLTITDLRTLLALAAR